MLYLQLSGWTAADAFLLGLFMIGAYLSYAYLTASLVDIEPLRRSEKICFRIQNLKMIFDFVSRVLQQSPTSPG